MRVMLRIQDSMDSGDSQDEGQKVNVYFEMDEMTGSGAIKIRNWPLSHRGREAGRCIPQGV